MQDIFELLLVPVTAIIDAFQKNQKLGIVIPEIPSHCHTYPLLFHNETQIHPMLEQLWGKMHCRKKIDFSSLRTIIMPYGTMFWYRPAALRSLFDLHLARDDFPPEPLADNYTLAYYIERLPVYIAWNDGYDYRIMTFSPPKISSFIGNMVISDYDSIRFSKTYRAGEFIMALPKLIKKLLH